MIKTGRDKNILVNIINVPELDSFWIVEEIYLVLNDVCVCVIFLYNNLSRPPSTPGALMWPFTLPISVGNGIIILREKY